MARRNVGGPVDFGSARGINVASGTAASDVATYGQLLAVKQGMDLHDPVRAATTTAITRSGLQTVDGVSLNAGDRVLDKDATDATARGIYVAAAGTWARAGDADENAEVTPGFVVTVLEGTTKGTGTAQSNPILWGLTNQGAITLGTTSLTFAPVGAAGASYLAGNGLNLTSTTFSVTPKSGGGIVVDGTGVSVDASYAKLANKNSQAIGDGSTTAITVTHNLGTKDRLGEPLLYLVSSGEVVEADVLLGTNADTVTFGTAPASGAYRYCTAG